MTGVIFYVYILASRKHGTLYIGVTNNLRTRLDQHRSGHGSEFVKNMRCTASSTWRSSQPHVKRSRGKSS
jgi:putative endonuclease